LLISPFPCLLALHACDLWLDRHSDRDGCGNAVKDRGIRWPVVVVLGPLMPGCKNLITFVTIVSCVFLFGIQSVVSICNGCGWLCD
jgi:hypothetical protein